MARARTIEMNTTANGIAPAHLPVAKNNGGLGGVVAVAAIVALLLLAGLVSMAGVERISFWGGLVLMVLASLLLITAVAGVIYLLIHLAFQGAVGFESLRQARSQTSQFKLEQLKLAAEVAEAEARAAKARRESEVFVVTAPFDHQVHISDMNHDALWRGAHQEARVYANGHYTDPTPQEMQARQLWLAGAGKNAGKVIEAGAQAIGLLPAGAPVVAEPLPDYVDLFELLKTRPSIHNLAFGVAIDEMTGQRRPLTADLLDLTHIAIAGSSGWGKSSIMRSILYQVMLAEEKPAMLLVDLENNALAPFAGNPRLLRPLATTEDDARRVFGQLYHEMTRRLKIFEKFHIDDLKDYQRLVAEAGAPPLRPIVCAVDEFNDLMEIEDLRPVIQRVARHCRKTGIRLIFAAQEWTMKYIDNMTQRQMSTRIQFYATDRTQARQLVGPGGARVMEAPKKGRAVLLLPGHEFTLLQTPYLHREAIMQANPNAPRPPAADELDALTLPGSVFDGDDVDPLLDEPAASSAPASLSDREQAILTAWDAGTRDEKTLAELAYGAVGGKQYGLVRSVLQRHGRLQPDDACTHVPHVPVHETQNL